MSRSKMSLGIAVLDAEIEAANATLRECRRKAAEAEAVRDALEAARSKMRIAAPTRAPRAAKPWKPRGPVEKQVVTALGHGVRLTAEALRDATGAAAPSLKAALARMKEAGAVVLVEDRYSLAGGEQREAAE